MATIPFVDTFDCQAPFPLDLRSVKSNIGQRDAIPNNARYDGMEVWVVNDQKKYRLEGGTANENWVEVTTGGGGSGTLQDVTFSSTAPTTQGNDGDIWFRPNNDTIELYYKVSGIWGMVGSWSNLELGETSDTAYRGDRGKIAYDHSQIISGNPHGTTAADVGAVNKSGDTMTGGLILMMGTSTQVPLLLPNGVLATVPVVGALEHSNRDLFFTNLWGQRRALEIKKTLKNISGTTYNLNSEDTKFYLSFTNAAGCTVTVSPSIATNGDTIEGEQLTSGKVSFVSGSGMTLTKPNSKNLTTSEQGAVFKIYFKSGVTAHVYGDLELT